MSLEAADSWICKLDFPLKSFVQVWHLLNSPYLSIWISIILSLGNVSLWTWLMFQEMGLTGVLWAAFRTGGRFERPVELLPELEAVLRVDELVGTLVDDVRLLGRGVASTRGPISPKCTRLSSFEVPFLP